ncbi:MAG: DUF3050 domain-containing protein [Verrucomicrobia bacterium]|nr:DUF3050 domain-containing protein [Verrucomicrobiota bacterium]
MLLFCSALEVLGIARFAQRNGLGRGGPLTMLLLNELCGSDPVRQAEAEAAACNAISARIRFWDGVLKAIEANVSPRHLLSRSRIGGSAR